MEQPPQDNPSEERDDYVRTWDENQGSNDMDAMCLPQEMLNIGSASTNQHFPLLPPFSSSAALEQEPCVYIDRTSDMSSSTPAATPDLIEPLPDEVMTQSFVLNHCRLICSLNEVD
ncbi:hypothetical protein PAMP_001613 [Pampus punctatissimus]